MRKNFYLLMLCIGLSLTSYAQEGFHAGLQYGFYGVGMSNGINNATKADLASPKFTNPMTGYVSKWGASYGLAVGYGFIPILSVSVELNTMATGQNSKGTGAGGAEVTRNVDLNYTQIPIFLKFRTEGEMAHTFIMAGPQFNFLSSASISDTRPDHTITDAKSMFASSDMGLAFGIGMEIDIPKVFFNIGIKGYYGFSDPTSPEASQTTGNTSTGTYAASQNFYAGLFLGAHYKF